MHLKRCARSDQKRIKIITKERNQMRKIVNRAMREAEQKMNDLFDKLNNVFKLVKLFKKKKVKWWMMFERNKWQICVQ